MEYLGPWAASVLFATVLRGRQLGQDPKVELPTAPVELRAYCAFSGMSMHFAGGPAPEPDHRDCETIPLMQFREARGDLANGLLKLVRRHRAIDLDTEDNLRTCVQEVTQNVIDHSDSPIGGVMSARYFSASQEVRVGIVDRGMGVLASLRRARPAVKDAETALRLISRGGVSSKSRPNNMGLGVSNLFCLMDIVQGRIAVFSSDAVARSVGSSVEIERTRTVFPGTAVFFTLPLTARAGRLPDETL